MREKEIEIEHERELETEEDERQPEYELRNRKALIVLMARSCRSAQRTSVGPMHRAVVFRDYLFLLVFCWLGAVSGRIWMVS